MRVYFCRNFALRFLFVFVLLFYIFCNTLCMYPVNVLVNRISMKLAERKKDNKLSELLVNYFAYLYALLK